MDETLVAVLLAAGLVAFVLAYTFRPGVVVVCDGCGKVIHWATRRPIKGAWVFVSRIRVSSRRDYCRACIPEETK